MMFFKIRFTLARWRLLIARKILCQWLGLHDIQWTITRGHVGCARRCGYWL